MAIDIRLPLFPECWETCGNCGQGEVEVLEVHVQPGDTVRHEDNLITLETGKVALDIPSPRDGTIVEVLVSAGDTVREGALIARIEPA
jgi:pyruvate/2-oxoglutarate dehydrogenase complex dihydrolipoamide acyltransferase (E2) component